MTISFSTRSTDVEIMDDLTFDGEVIYQTLRELDVINYWLGGNQVTLNAIKQVWQTQPRSKTLSIADLGCGSGEMLRLILKKAKLKKRSVSLMGIDANPNIAAYARQHSKNMEELNFSATNIFSIEFQKHSYDIVLATLFLHHFSNKELIEIFALLKRQTNVAIIVNDIHRHPLAYYSIKWLTSIFSRSSMVKYDAPLSVLRAFKRRELIEILKNAGIENYQLKWKWAFRWQLIIFC